MQFIDAHCHIFNFKCVPDCYFPTRAPVREWLLRRRGFHTIVRVMSWLVPGKKFDRLHEALALMKGSLGEVTDTMLSENRNAGIVLSTPLMMDLRHACGEKAEFPYRFQIAQIERLTLEHHGLLMPFIMVDPRRPGIVPLAIECLEQRGFLGVKVYPPLGYHPDPKSVINDVEVSEALAELWTYCNEHGVPVTAHCSQQGAYSQDLRRSREVCLECTHPRAWKGVLNDYPKLRVNLAHFGGNFLRVNETGSWSNEIVRMMARYPGRLYADLSYHDEALQWSLWRRKRNQREYFDLLNRKLTSGSASASQILFGSDWPMTRHTWLQGEYVDPFRKHCSPSDALQRLCQQNALQFLFDGPVPGRIESFFTNHGVNPKSLTHFVQGLLPPAPPGPPAAPTVQPVPAGARSGEDRS
jgi:predicted TIM-barrel fold metal-dependent hydrolase